VSAQPPVPTGKLVLLRHGETDWSASGRHTGRTDVPLSPHGEQLAAAAGGLLVGYRFALALTSPLQRARRTAELAGLPAIVDENLLEWDYGGYEGRTTQDIRAELGYQWTVFANGVPPGDTRGETIEEVAARASRVVARAVPALAEGDVALIGHGHCLRVLTAVFLHQEPRMAAQILMDAGSVSVLQFDREQPAIRTWNRTPELPRD
jgi:broad specificity phosphatase PhoE